MNIQDILHRPIKTNRYCNSIAEVVSVSEKYVRIKYKGLSITGHIPVNNFINKIYSKEWQFINTQPKYMIYG